MGVSMATTKLPVQLAAVVMETATPLTLRGNISLVTTHATGLHNEPQYNSLHNHDVYTAVIVQYNVVIGPGYFLGRF